MQAKGTNGKSVDFREKNEAFNIQQLIDTYKNYCNRNKVTANER